MKKLKLPKGSIRITVTPETFIFPVKSKTGTQMWKLINSSNRTIGVYLSQGEAKEAAISFATRFFRTPKAYKEQYAAKLRSYEGMRREMLCRDDDEDS